MIKLDFNAYEIVEHFQAGMLYVNRQTHGYRKVKTLKELVLLSRVKARFYLYSS